MLDQARHVVHQLYQLFKTHPHEAQWTKESKPLCGVSGGGGVGWGGASEWGQGVSGGGGAGWGRGVSGGGWDGVSE